jgi:hypothetical protein
MFWLQLSQAEFITGNFTGLSGPGSATDNVPGVNVPETRYPNGCMNVDIDNPLPASMYFTGSLDYIHYIEIGSDMVTGDCDEPLFTPHEAFRIDTKLDDGMPGKGKVAAKYWDTCANGSSAADSDIAEYRLDVNSPECSLLIFNPFQ